MTGAYSQQGPLDDANDANTLLFAFTQMLNKLAGPTLVKVVKCTNTGGVAAQGTVDVQPLVNQMTGNRQPIKHGVVYGLPYLRIMGGQNAIIMDPQPGDIGLACFCSRDISAVKAAKGQANPGSYRTWDWADGLYLYSFLGGVPVNYIQAIGNNINVFSTDTINIQAANGINLTAPTVAVQGNLTVSGTTTGQGDGVFEGTDVHTHTHGGVQTGGGDTGPPV